MASKSNGSDKFCGKEYHKYLYFIVALAVAIMVGGYWYSEYYGKSADGRLGYVQGGVNSVRVPNPASNAPGVAPLQPQAMAAAMATQQNDPLAADPSLLNRPWGFAAVVKSMMPSVVNISAHNDSPLQAQATGPAVGPELPQAGQTPSPGGLQFANPFSGVSQESIGSGIIVTEEGHILTNFHVVENSKNVVVMVYGEMGDKSYHADVVARDNTRDLALLLIEPAGKLKSAALGNSENAQIGDSVITIGSPFGLNHSVSKGIVAGKRKVVNIGGVLHKGLLQTDAAINRGNSGGPLVDGQGWVIGVNTAIYTTTSAFSGVGFAVPINTARDFLEDWITLPNVRPDLPMPGQAAGAHVAVRPPPPIQANAKPPHGDRGPCANCHDILPGPQPVAFTNAAAPQTKGPPIQADAALPHDDWGPCVNCHQIIPSPQPIAFGVGPGPGLHQKPGLGMGKADEGNFDAMQQFSFSPGGAIGVTVAAAGMADSVAAAGDAGLGVTWSMLDAARSEGLQVPVPFGAVIDTVHPGMSGESLGFRANDVLLKVDGRWLKTMGQVQESFDRLQRGDAVRFLVHRGGVRMELDTARRNVGGQPSSATWLPVAGPSPMMQQPMTQPQISGGQNGIDPMLAAEQGQFAVPGQNFPPQGNPPGVPGQAKPAAPPTEFEWMGMEMVPMDQAAWQRNPDLRGKFGGLVADVDVGAQAERAGIRRGDLVVAINGLPVPSATALDNAIKAVKVRTGVLVEIERMNQRMFATLQ
ncbi:MAG: peptidase S1 and S6, chymotrypsin/Hap [Magnetococcales bacterium]|nr:peptidase S1 and S6, chymotrypsin/Hap [Magnetococcales bacterium]